MIENFIYLKYNKWMHDMHDIYAGDKDGTVLLNLLCRNTRGTHRPSFLFTVSLNTYSFTRVSNPACWNKPAKYSRTDEKQNINFNAVKQMIKKKQMLHWPLEKKKERVPSCLT